MPSASVKDIGFPNFKVTVNSKKKHSWTSVSLFWGSLLPWLHSRYFSHMKKDYGRLKGIRNGEAGGEASAPSNQPPRDWILL